MKLISESETKILLKNGFLVTNIPAYSENLAIDCLLKFMNQPFEYRQQYLQKNYHNGFDGYSYLGQYDSTNQDPQDLVHTFVLSSLNPKADYPKELRPLLISFNELRKTLMNIENLIFKKIFSKIPELIINRAYMVSSNYYPNLPKESFEQTTHRLTQHQDISFITIFPFGNPDGLAYERDGKWIDIASSNKMIIHLGYGTEYLTKGIIKGANHKVHIKNSTSERLSFAYFSIPNPLKQQAEASEYFENYLSLFE